MTPQPFTRRRMLIGGAVAAGAALAGGLGAGKYRSGSKTPTVVGGLQTPSASSADPTRTAAPRPRGGIARIPSPGRFNFDTFDAQQTGEPSVLEVLGRTHSRLLDWGDSADPILVPGLAARWEQPDRDTLVFHLDPRARWDERSPAKGRAVTGEDVRAHFMRNIALAAGALPIAQRAADFSRLRVSAPEPSIVTARPEDFLSLNTFASRYALIQAPEAVDPVESARLRPEQVAGSGAFRFMGRREGGPLIFEAARGGHVEANLDGLEVFEPGGPDDLLSFRIDEHLARDRREAASLRSKGQLLELSRYEESPVISTFFVGAPPWDNPTLLRAISGALNRSWLGEALFGGRAEACGPVSPASGSFALSRGDMARYAGFGADANADGQAARAAWEAAGGTALGPVTIDYPSVFDPLYSASSVVTGRLNEVLGPQFHAAVETYTTISAKTAEGRYGNGRAAFWFGWGPPLLEPDPSRSLVETYSSNGATGAALGIRSSALDARLAAITGAGRDGRAGAVREATFAILEADGSGIITWLLQRAELFRWPYISGPQPSPFWRQQHDDARAIDPASPLASRRVP